MPQISIIMPLYNSAEFLKESIESILYQTYTDWEFIIINEFGSEDGSREIVEEYMRMDKRFILIQNEQKLGISESMNRGLEIASGTYIARMDADDISLPQRFEKQVEYLENHLDIVMCGVKVEIFGSNPFEWELETDTEKLATNILFYSPSVHPTVMVRRDFLEQYQIRYNKEYKASEDYDFFAQICRYGKIANLEEVLFRYRIMNNNATFKNSTIGMEIYSNVMERQFQELGLHFSKAEIELLSPHYSIKNLKGDAVLEALQEIELLLQKIFLANEKIKRYSRRFLWKTLQKRFKETCGSTEWFCKDFDRSKVNMIETHSIFCREEFYKAEPVKEGFDPKVTVLIPTYCSENYILGTLWSVLEQTYQNFEIVIVNEYGSDDDTCFIAEIFGDKRIRIIQNTEKLGLAESLNLGIREAKGIYIARMDADDLCHQDRLRLQVEFLENNKDFGICGSWQHHFGIKTEWIHKCSVSYEDIQAELLFNCDLCHSTLMLRKEYFIENNLFYDSSYAAEDYELWTRAVRKFKIANLPMVLGEYRVGESNITAKKMDMLSLESGQLAARNIQYYFKVKISSEMIPLQSGWRNEFDKLSVKERNKALEKEKEILKKIWKVNQREKEFNENSLLKTINKRWHMITNTPQEEGEWYGIEELFQKYEYNHINVMIIKNKVHSFSVKQWIKRILWKPYYAIRRRTVDKIIQNIWDADGHTYDYYSKIMQQCYDIDGHLYDYYIKIKQECLGIQDFYNKIQLEQNHSLQDIIKLLDSNQLETISLYEKIKELEEKIEKQTVKIEEMEQEGEKRIIHEMITKVQEIGQNKDRILNEELIKIREIIYHTAKEINEITDTRIWKAEQSINEITDARIWKAEQSINEITDARIWKAEQEINQTTDARIWKTEQEINQTTDARIWKMEQNLNETIEKTIWEDGYRASEKIEKGIQKAEQSINEITDARIWKAEQNIIDMQKVLAELLLEFQKLGKKVVLINTPSHDNLGDHAIAYAETAWIKEKTDYSVIDITGDLYRQYHTVIHKFIKEEDIIAISGGGYIGNLWECEEQLVEQVILEYPNNAIRVFPQSVYFTDNKEGTRALTKAQEIFQKHQNLVLFAREEFSYLFLKENFPKCQIDFAMDMAFYLQKQTNFFYHKAQNRKGIAICLKSDKESIFSEQEKEEMNKITKKQGEKLIFTDTVMGYPIDKWQRSLELSRKLEEFSGYKLIITDRLHGVIFSVLTQTPCIIWRGVSYKNKGIYQILSRYIALHYAENLKEFEKILENGIPVWKVIDQQGLEQQMTQGLDRFAKTLEIKKRI